MHLWWEIIRGIPKYAMENIFASASVAALVLICTLLLWLRKFQNEGLVLEKAKREKQERERESKIEKMLRKIEKCTAKLPPNRVTDIIPSPDDDLEIFEEAKRRWKQRK